MSNRSRYYEAKLNGERLKAHAQTDSDEVLSVLVQPDLPLQPRPFPVRVLGQPPAWGAVKRTVGDNLTGDGAKVRERVTAFLAELLGHEATWLGAARVFVVALTPSELRQVTRHPEVQRVLNREVRLRSLERRSGEHVPSATVDTATLSKKGEVEGPS